MKENLTEIVMIIDRSGSMISIKDDAQGGFNSFIEEQKKLPGEARLTLVQFDSEIEKIHDNIDLKDIPPYVLRPRGATALLDAVGSTINSIGIRLANTPEDERPSKILVCIITDGYENSSYEFSQSQIKEMIKHQESKYSWEFIFIGGDIDTISQASSIGITNTVSFAKTALGTENTFNYLAREASTYRTCGKLNKTHYTVQS